MNEHSVRKTSNKIIGEYGKCKYCGADFGWLLLEAIMCECGAKAYPLPTWCPNSPDNKHHPEEKKVKEE
jgi:hypothetical protein